MAKVLLLFFFGFVTSSRAEYRTYKLAITQEGNRREIITNFDQNQYPGIYPLNAGENIEYVDSWMCWGRQGEGVPACPNPREPQPTSGSAVRAPAEE